MPTHIPLAELVPLAAQLVLISVELNTAAERYRLPDADRSTATIKFLGQRCAMAKTGAAKPGDLDRMMRALEADASNAIVAEGVASQWVMGFAVRQSVSVR
jgi:hypothetical protein